MVVFDNDDAKLVPCAWAKYTTSGHPVDLSVLFVVGGATGQVDIYVSCVCQRRY